MNVNWKIKFFCIFLCLLSYFGNGSASCGYESCHPVEKDEINIHLVPHTHDDLGWLKTVDQYYYGTHKNIDPAGVKYILDDVVKALQENSDRRFIYVEMGFFFKWWNQQDEETQNIVKNLVNNGQLEFISGGWSMNDEATTYYQTIIDNMALGLRKLNETFGECGRPKVAWQIDPFGHSRQMASIFAQLGFDGFFLNRIDYQDLDIRKLNRTMEFVWRGSPNNLGESTDIYTNVLFRHYSAPSGLCFDIRCDDDPIVDDINSTEYNVKQKVEDFINNWVVPASQVYASNNVLVPMGDDFNYEYAEQYFENIDKLIKYINEVKTFDGVRYNIIYSTPSCYLNAVYQATNGTLNAPLKTDDFFPYASSAHSYWTGYFTSRPTGKAYSRYANNFLQVCKQLRALTNVSSIDGTKKLSVLREAVGIFQHHDAITGTEKENVTHDYMKLLHDGIVKCEEVTDEILFNLVNAKNMTFTTCPMLNISECARTENEEKLIITVYNPLGRSVNKYVRLPIVDNTTQIVIRDPSGAQVNTQVLPVAPSVLNIPGRSSSANFELTFRADNVPPLGFKSFYFENNPSQDYELFEKHQEELDSAFNHHVHVNSSSLGSKVQVQNQDGLTLSVSVKYWYYSGFIGNDTSSDVSSAYVFRPDPDVPIQPASSTITCTSYSSDLVPEFHCYVNDWLSFVHRVYEGLDEFNYLVGPLPYDQQGVEVVARFNTDLYFYNKYYTDTNGRESILRMKNYRPTWAVNIAEPESGNYYPVVTGMTIKDSHGPVITILTDRALGIGSIESQSVEFMIHRNTLKSSGGVGEALNEQAYGTGVVSSGSHYVLFGGSDLTATEKSQEIYLDSWLFFASPNGLSFEEYRKKHVMEFSGLANVTLPRNVHILTLEPWGSSRILLRLENFVEQIATRHAGTSTVNVQELFSTFDILSLKETTLGGNQWLAESNRIRFNNEANGEKRNNANDGDFNVTLDPMQIRTFILTIAYK